MRLIQFVSVHGEVVAINPEMISVIHRGAHRVGTEGEGGALIVLSTGHSIPTNEPYADLIQRLRTLSGPETKG